MNIYYQILSFKKKVIYMETKSKQFVWETSWSKDHEMSQT